MFEISTPDDTQEDEILTFLLKKLTFMSHDEMFYSKDKACPVIDLTSTTSACIYISFFSSLTLT